MQAELKLYLDKNLLDRAKLYSDKIGKSVAQIIADYFAFLDEKSSPNDSELSPIVRSL